SGTYAWHSSIRLHQNRLWNMRVVQGSVVCCAVESGSNKFCSGSCALRRVRWRGAPLKNSKGRHVTASCALRRNVWRVAQSRVL
ncbi:hypothetical protein A2U01_0055600, partial [Trifolium medium]|nr:hypothetical protein [Trifolium medium]